MRSVLLAALLAFVLWACIGPEVYPDATAPAVPAGQDRRDLPGPGLKATITSATIGADRKIVITFRATDEAGSPLRLADLDAPVAGMVAIARIDRDGDTGLSKYVSYNVAEGKGAGYLYQGEVRQPAIGSLVRPYFVERPGPDSLTETAPGNFAYTLASLAPEGYPASATHVVGLALARSDRNHVANATFNFIPAGAGTPLTRRTVATANCNQCHDPLMSHGGLVRDTGMCVLCHTSQSFDLESGNSLEFTELVHKVHAGADLPSVQAGRPYYSVTRGGPQEFSGVRFPQDLRACTACHGPPPGVGEEDYARLAPNADNHKNAPSAAACGACHDDVDFTTGGNHGGKTASDADCKACHRAEGSDRTAVTVAHKVDPPPFKHRVELGLTAPANGKFYVAGEAPQVTVAIKDAATGNPIAPAIMVEPRDTANVQANEWRRLNLFVSGPRGHTVPVLTAAAARREADKSYASVDLRVLRDPAKADPRISRTVTSIVYQLDDVKGLKPGTYTAFVEAMPDAPLGGWAVVNFQVGTAAEDKVIATNCTSCHGDSRMHESFFAVQFNTDICKSCHDYLRQGAGVGDSGLWWNGFGAAPIVKKVHGVHASRDLEHPEDLVAPRQRDQTRFAVGFPGDLKNCARCHNETPSWKEVPSRLACLSCHDSSGAVAHAALQTMDQTPDNPWSGDETETCGVCHGPGGELPTDQVHVARVR